MHMPMHMYMHMHVPMHTHMHTHVPRASSALCTGLKVGKRRGRACGARTPPALRSTHATRRATAGGAALCERARAQARGGRQ